jgi:hypothetical protein
MHFSLMIHSDEYVIAPREPSHGKNMTFQLLSTLKINCFAFLSVTSRRCRRLGVGRYSD